LLTEIAACGTLSLRLGFLEDVALDKLCAEVDDDEDEAEDERTAEEEEE
jgi:hypothetical protein